MQMMYCTFEQMIGYICTTDQLTGNEECTSQKSSLAVGILARAAVVEVGAPVAIVAVLHVIAVGLLSEGAHALWGA
jgi:hypothetical protein